MESPIVAKDKPFVAITWRDAEDGPTWATEKEAVNFAQQDCLVESRGWLLRKTKTFVVIAADKTLSGNNPDEFGRISKIPTKMIINTEILFPKAPPPE